MASSSPVNEIRYLNLRGRVPEADDQTANDDQCPAYEDRRAWDRAECDEADDLPHDKERRDIQPDETFERLGRKIEHDAVAEQQSRSGQQNADSSETDPVKQTRTDNGVATCLERGRGNQESEYRQVPHPRLPRLP